MTAEELEDAKIAQYEVPPAEGLTRYWIRFGTYLEDWPEDTPFFFWHTGSGNHYVLRPSVMNTPEAQGLPFQTDLFLRNFDPELKKRFEEDEELHDRMYVSDAYCTALIDAVDEKAVWELVLQHFPDAEHSFCNVSDRTLTGLSKGGRFQHPAGEVQAEATGPSPM